MPLLISAADWEEDAELPRKKSPAEYLEELRITRERGFGLDYEEFKKGICCIAAPVFGSDHECAGAIGVTGGSEEYKNSDKFEDLKKIIVETAGLISAKIS